MGTLTWVTLGLSWRLVAIEILEGNALAKSITVLVGRGLLETLNQARLMDFLDWMKLCLTS